MNTTTIQQEITNWINLVIAVVILLIGGFFQVKSYYDGKMRQQQIDNANKRLDKHAEKIDTLQQNMTPPNQPPSVNLAVASGPNGTDVESSGDKQ